MKSHKSKKRIPADWIRAQQEWPRFHLAQCYDAQKTIELMVNSMVGCDVLGSHSHRDSVEKLTDSASIPLSIDSLSEALLIPRISRGELLSGLLGTVIDKIARNYPNMYWWMSDKGLNMQVIEPSNALPDPFDEMAGTLMIRHWKDERVSPEALLEIAGELDKNEVVLKDSLQPKEWAVIAEYNQKFPKKAIRTFYEAAKHQRFSRLVRRSLYRARDKKIQGPRATQSTGLCFDLYVTGFER